MTMRAKREKSRPPWRSEFVWCVTGRYNTDGHEASCCAIIDYNSRSSCVVYCQFIPHALVDPHVRVGILQYGRFDSSIMFFLFLALCDAGWLIARS